MSPRNRADDGFTNPYAFARMPTSPPHRKPPTPHDAYDPNLLSGRLRIEIRALTPTFTPGPSGAADTNDHGVARLRMARLKNNYAIPGSELKGVVRSLAETLTGSCLRVVHTPGAHSYRPRADEETALKYAFMVVDAGSGDLALVPLIDDPLPVRPDQKLHNDLTGRVDGQEVTFDIVQGCAMLNANDAYAGILKLSDVPAGSSRRNQRVVSHFEHDVAPVRPPNFDDIIADYNDAIAPSIAEDKREFGDDPGPFLCGRNLSSEEDRQRWGLRHRRHPLRPGDVVWADSEFANQISVIGPVQIARRRRVKTTAHAIPPGFEPCPNPDDLCWACRVFGMAPEDKQVETPGVAGHVEISWATGPEIDPGVCRDIGLPRMEGPKPSYGPFYLMGDANGAGSWDGNVRIAGRKYYWHWSSAHPQERRQDAELNVEAVRAGTVFEADVRFSNLSREDFGLLLAALDPRLLGEGWDEAGHKIGMGKPLGLGSVETTITEAVLINRADRYGSLETTESEKSLNLGVENCLQPYVSAFLDRMTVEHGDDPRHVADLRILLTHRPTGKITWPRGRNDSDRGYEWFRDRVIPLPLPGETAAGRQLPRL